MHPFKPLVSFVIATRNSSSRIAPLLESIKDFAPSGQYEVLISDSNSNDSTLQIVNKYTPYMRIRIASLFDTGIYNAWNKAIVIASGSWLIFLGDDDRLYSREDSFCVFNFLSKLNSDPGFIILFNAFLGPPKSARVSPYYDRDLLWKGIKFFHPSSALPHTLFKHIQFDESLRIISDYKLFATLRLNHIYCPYTFAYIGQNGISKNSKLLLLKEVLAVNLSLYRNVVHILFLPLVFILNSLSFPFRK